MAIYANPEYWERDQEGHIDHVLVAVKYTGPDRFYSNNSTATQGRWPTRGNFLQDIWYVAFVPEDTPEGASGEGVAWFDRHEHFEVAYEPADIARAIVEYNGGELVPGGPIGEGDTVPGFDGRVREALGLEEQVQAGKTYEEQLRELADIDDADAVEEPDPVDEFVGSYTRAELKEVVKATREDAEEFSLRGKSMQDMAEYLVGQEVDP